MGVWRRVLLLVVLLSLLTGCDQATKRMAVDELKFSAPQSYAGDLVRIQYSENQGAFLGLGAGLSPEARVWLFTVGTGILLLGMLLLVLRYGDFNRLAWVGFVVYLGGGSSNLADRIMNRGLVIDFLNLGIGPVRTGIFNFADLFIVIGVLALLAASLRLSSRQEAT